MLTWFRSLMPKQGRFFASFEAHASAIGTATRELDAMLSLAGTREAHMSSIARLEREADEVRQQVLEDVRRVFVTPFDRGAIVGLINVMDDAIDQANKTARTILLYDIGVFDREMCSLAAIAVDASGIVEEAMPLLRAIGPNASRLDALTNQVIALEERADALHDEGLRNLYRSGGDAITFVVRREVYQHLERIVDRLEDVAVAIHGLVIDHA